MTKSPGIRGDGTEKRIIFLVKRVREDGCDKSFEELYAYLSGYIDVFEKKYRIPGCDADEIQQECLFALRYKAIEDFNPKRGKFRSFAVLCMKRHLFSIIKGSNQQKRKVLNESLSLDEDRSEGDHVSLINLISKTGPSCADEIEKTELINIAKEKLLQKLSKLEQHVLMLYLQQRSYDEIAKILSKEYPKRTYNRKAIDNSLTRVRQKAQQMLDVLSLFEDT